MSLILWIWAAILGWLLSLLINYLADVLPVKRRLGKPFCSACGEDLSCFEYFGWPNRCPRCSKQKRARYWIVEIFSVLLSLLLIYDNPLPEAGWIGLLLIGYLMLVTVVDLEHRLILHSTSLVGGFLCLGSGIWLHGTQASLLGGVAGFSIMLGFYLFGLGFVKLLKKTRPYQIEEQEGIGFGDVILGGVMGFLLGWPGITVGIVLAILIGGAVSLIVLVLSAVRKTYSPNLAVPYGPFLTVSAFILLFIRNWLS